LGCDPFAAGVGDEHAGLPLLAMPGMLGRRTQQPSGVRIRSGAERQFPSGLDSALGLLSAWSVFRDSPSMQVGMTACSRPSVHALTSAWKDIYMGRLPVENQLHPPGPQQVLPLRIRSRLSSLYFLLVSPESVVLRALLQAGLEISFLPVGIEPPPVSTENRYLRRAAYCLAASLPNRDHFGRGSLSAFISFDLPAPRRLSRHT
jgi:hypothetical protein